MGAHSVWTLVAIAPEHIVARGTVIAWGSHARIASVTPGTLAHNALTCTLDSVTPFLGLLRREDFFDLGLESGEHFTRGASVFLAECHDTLVVSMKDLTYLLALLGGEIEVSNEPYRGALREPCGIAACVLRLGAQNQYSQRATDHGAGNQKHCTEAEGA